MIVSLWWCNTGARENTDYRWPNILFLLTHPSTPYKEYCMGKLCTPCGILLCNIPWSNSNVNQLNFAVVKCCGFGRFWLITRDYPYIILFNWYITAKFVTLRPPAAPYTAILLCDGTLLNRHVNLHYTIPKPYFGMLRQSITFFFFCKQFWSEGKIAYQGDVGGLKAVAEYSLFTVYHCIGMHWLTTVLHILFSIFWWTNRKRFNNFAG